MIIKKKKMNPLLQYIKKKSWLDDLNHFTRYDTIECPLADLLVNNKGIIWKKKSHFNFKFLPFLLTI